MQTKQERALRMSWHRTWLTVLILVAAVGAAISTWRPDWISGQARACGGVGAVYVRRNQFATAGWNCARTSCMRHCASSGWLRA